MWSRADWEGMKNMIRQQRWSMLSRGTLNEAWKELTNRIEEAKTTFVPTAKIKNRTQPKWMNRELQKLIRQKRNAWKAFRNHGTLENHEKYEKLEQEVVKKVRNAKRRLEKEIATTKDKNNKQFTNYVKSKTKSKTSIGPLRNRHGVTLTEDKEIADHLNMFFTSVFTKDMGSLDMTLERETDARLDRIDITEARVRKTIKKFKERLSPRPRWHQPTHS